MSTSKFKNALGADAKQKFTDCSVSTVSTEGRLIAVNSDFLAMAWSNVGEIVVVDSATPFRIKRDQPRIKGHHSQVLDLEFSPFSNELLACTYDDCTVSLWRIPEEGLTEHITQEVQTFQRHTKKASFVNFNPVASDVMCTAAALGEIFIWNAAKGEAFVELKADDTPTITQWNPNGSLLGVTTKNKMINIFDPRANKMVLKQQVNEAFQSAKFTWTDNDTFVTSSWTKTGAKTLKLWDVRKVKEDLSSEGEVTSIQIDTSKTVTTPFADKESKLIYCVGKGEASTHIFDYNEGKFVKGISFASSEPSICSVMFERRCVDYNTLEIDRFARYVNSGKVFYVSFTIPRRNPIFDPTLYPPVESGEAALTYDQWVGGETAEPVKKEITTFENQSISKVDEPRRKQTRVEKKLAQDKIKELEAIVSEMTDKINELTEENAKLKKEIEEKKAKKGETAKTEEPKPEEPKPEETKVEEVHVEEEKPEGNAEA